MLFYWKGMVGTMMKVLKFIGLPWYLFMGIMGGFTWWLDEWWPW